MSITFERVRELILAGDVRISSHGYDELGQVGILARDVVEGFRNAHIVEDYPDYPKGPCVLVLQRDTGDRPTHVI